MPARIPALLLGAVLLGAAAPAPRPVVVELFTSEGCSSCPPAEALLADLAHSRRDVLPLAFHITYWNRLGWPDPYSLPAATARQRAYVPLLGATAATGSVYTPQMVIDGRQDALGSDRDAVLAAIRAAARDPSVPVSLALRGGSLSVRVAQADGAPPSRLLLVGYDRHHRTAIRRGENAGLTLNEANVVRSLTDLGPWRGEAVARSVPVPAGETFALLLQRDDGPIVGAAVAGGSPAS